MAQRGAGGLKTEATDGERCVADSRIRQRAPQERRLPARAPLQASSSERIPEIPLWMPRFAMQPAAAARVVVVAVLAATNSHPWMQRVEPGLKPYHPNQRRKVPNTTSAALWPGIGSSTLPVSGSKRPARGPRTAAPIMAEMPPTMCTTPQPAKSITPTSTRGGVGGKRGGVKVS